MKRNLLKTTILATLGATSLSCGVESGIIVVRQQLPEENAFYVNIITNHEKELFSDDEYRGVDGWYQTDRKLFFMDAKYQEPLIYGMPGDTITYSNPFKKKYLYMNRFHHVRSINGVNNKKIVKRIRSVLEHQK